MAVAGRVDRVRSLPQGHPVKGDGTISGLTIESVQTQLLPDAANPQLLVHVRDTAGAVGTGETWWGTYQPTAPPGTPVRAIAVFIDTILAPVCEGLRIDRVSDIAAVYDQMQRAVAQYGPEGVTSIAISGVDVALWNLLAHRNNSDTADLLGKRFQHSVRAYASLSWLGDAEAVVDTASGAIEHGFRAVKLHEADVELILEVRRTLDPDIAMMLDVSGRWSFDEAAQAIPRLGRAGLVWIEEPVYPYTDHRSLALLRKVANDSGTLLAAGENEFGPSGFERLLAAAAVDVLQPDLVKCGGLSATGPISALADDSAVAIAPHNFSLGPSLLANMAWAAVEPSVRWLEVPWLGAARFPSGMDVPEVVDGAVAV
ncbi:MAG: mandelate racemase/muconate lactonizing enzyme family protein [Acidimicrobiales bacterium]